MDELQRYGLTDRFINEATMYPDLQLGRVVAQYKGLYKVVASGGELLAEISGRLRYETEELAKYPAVGDFVMLSSEGGGNCLIHRILTRKSVFLRRAVGVSGQAQTVAANIDVAFICMSLNANFNLSRLERYLAIAWDSGATPVILLTKSDLCADLESAVSECERVSPFCDVVPLTAFDDGAIAALRPYLKAGVTAAFIGSSGVGKSTLINKLLGGDVVRTAEVGGEDKGRHTTTGREMYPCPLGGVLIDTPGMRELGAESADLSRSFSDIEALALRCRFKDCTHTGEPGCAVLAALESGELDERRLNNYFKLKNEAGYEGLSSRELENKKLERMFKDVGGMKNMRKVVKEKRRPT